MYSDVLHTIVVILGNFIEGYLFYILFDALFHSRKHPKIDIYGVILIHSIVMSLLNIMFEAGSFPTVIWMFGFWMIAGIYLYGRPRFYRYFLATVLFMVIIMVTELLGLFVVFLFGIGMDEAVKNTNLYMLLFVLTKMVQFFVITNLNYARLKKGMMKQLHMMTVGIIFVLNLVIVLLLIDILRFVDPTNQTLLNETIMLTGVIVLVNLLLYRLVNYMTGYIEREFHERLNEQYYKSETSHIKALKSQAVSFRKERHDIRNHLSAILALNKSGHFDKLESYIMEMLDASEESLIYKTDSAIEAIINNKVESAKKQGITTKVDLKIPPEGQLSEYDVAIIVGNAIDNAIEACLKVEGSPFIHIETSIKHGYFNIRIINSAQPTTKNLSGQFKTTKEDKINHGFGLNNIRSVVDKNHGLMQIERKSDTFEFKCSMLLGR